LDIQRSNVKKAKNGENCLVLVSQELPGSIPQGSIPQGGITQSRVPQGSIHRLYTLVDPFPSATPLVGMIG